MNEIIDKIKSKESNNAALQIRVPESLLERLTKCAEDNEVKISDIVREVLDKWLTSLKY